MLPKTWPISCVTISDIFNGVILGPKQFTAKGWTWQIWDR